MAALAFDGEQAAPIQDPEEEDEDLKPDIKPAIDHFQVAAIAQAIKAEPEEARDSEEGEPAPPGDEDDDPFGLGPRRSRSPPASRAQRRSIGATVSMRPRQKTKFFPSR